MMTRAHTFIISAAILGGFALHAWISTRGLPGAEAQQTARYDEHQRLALEERMLNKRLDQAETTALLENLGPRVLEIGGREILYRGHWSRTSAHGLKITDTYYELVDGEWRSVKFD